jgi:hypothetical protein
MGTPEDDDAEFLLEIEKEVAVSTGRQLALRTAERFKAESDMEDKAQQTLAIMKYEQVRLQSELAALKGAALLPVVSEGADEGDATDEGEEVDASTDGQEAFARHQRQQREMSEMERMFEDLVGTSDDDRDDLGDDGWLLPGSPANLTGSRPSSGVSDPQPVSPSNAAPAIAVPAAPDYTHCASAAPARSGATVAGSDSATGATSGSGPVHEQPRRRGAHPTGPQMDVGAYAAKRAAAVAKSAAIRQATELVRASLGHCSCPIRFAQQVRSLSR